MVILITGASHTGKTLLAQQLLERTHFPYLSVDHLKMGLIRSGRTALTPEDDDALTDYLWPIVREMAKTAIENRQDLIIEGAYIPLSWRQDLAKRYLRHILFVCLVMSRGYIERHFADIRAYAHIIERRLDDSDFTADAAIRDNESFFRRCRQSGERCIQIDGAYPLDLADRILRDISPPASTPPHLEQS